MACQYVSYFSHPISFLCVLAEHSGHLKQHKQLCCHTIGKQVWNCLCRSLSQRPPYPSFLCPSNRAKGIPLLCLPMHTLRVDVAWIPSSFNATKRSGDAKKRYDPFCWIFTRVCTISLDLPIFKSWWFYCFKEEGVFVSTLEDCLTSLTGISFCDCQRQI